MPKPPHIQQSLGFLSDKFKIIYNEYFFKYWDIWSFFFSSYPIKTGSSEKAIREKARNWGKVCGNFYIQFAINFSAANASSS